jgi:CRP-like cAMP-binding protein
MTDVDHIATHPFLEGMSDDHVATLLRAARPVGLAGGARVFTEGASADQFWLLDDGLVQLDIDVPGRGSVLIESLAAGTVLGWSWLFPPYAWHFGATAVEATRAVEFDAARVRRACDDDPVLGFALTQRFMRVMLDRLQATRLRLLDLYGAP